MNKKDENFGTSTYFRHIKKFVKIWLSVIAIIALAIAVPKHTASYVIAPTIATSSPITIQDMVINEFGSTSPMINIARCESNHRHYNPDGSVLRGKVNSDDVGVFQINEYYHLETSKKLGIDIHTPEGNIKYARFLYNSNGTRDWNWSKSCWGN